MLSYILIANRYIISRTKDDLESKIKIYKIREENKNKLIDDNINRTIMRTFCSKLTEEMIVDIKNEMHVEDFCRKYSVCESTFIKYRKEYYKLIGKQFKRTYKTKIDLDEYKKYRIEHTRKETVDYFNISMWLSYEYDRRLNIK